MARIRIENARVEFTPAPESESDRPPSMVPPDVEVEMDMVYEPGPLGLLASSEPEQDNAIVHARPWALPVERVTGHHNEDAWSHFGAWRDWLSNRVDDDLTEDEGPIVLDKLGSMQQVLLYVLCCNLADGDVGLLSPLSPDDRAALARCLADKNGQEMIRVALDGWRDTDV